MKPKDYYYNLMSKPTCRHTPDGEVDVIVLFISADDTYIHICLRKKKGQYEVHYPVTDLKEPNKCDYVYVDFKKNSSSLKDIGDYLFYFKSANHAKTLTKEEREEIEKEAQQEVEKMRHEKCDDNRRNDYSSSS